MNKPLFYKFKISAVFIALTLFNNLLIAEDKTQSKTAESIKHIELFSIGYIGFAGHISHGQKLYEDILNSENSESNFLKILSDPKSTAASKLYSLCGLKKISSKKYSSEKENIFLNYKDSTVSTMAADVMQKEDISHVIDKIDQFGC